MDVAVGQVWRVVYVLWALRLVSVRWVYRDGR